MKNFMNEYIQKANDPSHKIRKAAKIVNWFTVVNMKLSENLLDRSKVKIAFVAKGYDNTESSVRKASVFCLVAIYSVIGEELKPHLAQLTGSKMKLLNLYIKRAQTTNSNSSSSSDVSTHS
uniref:CLIP-associating protein 1 n=1 Tax=Sphaerodactylus townsendi TaxID=933632 RepID=A0ACB8G1P5_9SAUR